MKTNKQKNHKVEKIKWKYLFVSTGKITSVLFFLQKFTGLGMMSEWKSSNHTLFLYGILQQLVHGSTFVAKTTINRKLLRKKLEEHVYKNFFLRGYWWSVEETWKSAICTLAEGSGAVKLEKWGDFLVKSAIVKKLKEEGVNLFLIKCIVHSTK